MSHNSSQDSMAYHMTSMFHETLEQDAKLYEYLLEDDDDGIGSLPELESSAASSRMEDDSRKSCTSHMSRDRFGWTPSPTAKRRSNSLHPYLVQQPRDSQQQRECQSLQQQLQLAHNELAHVRHRNDLLKSSLYEKETQNYELIVKLRQRDEELEAKQVELDSTTEALEAMDIELEYVRMELHHQQTDAHEMAQQDNPYEKDVASHEDDDELQARIDECEQELQQLGVVIRTDSTPQDTLLNNNVSIPHAIPREIHMTHPMLRHSMGLAQSLIGLIRNDKDETKVMDRLCVMSELLDHDGEEEFSLFHDCVPFILYQRLEQRCHVLESERSQVLTLTLDLMESAREANAMELEIRIKEMKDRHQKQVEECVSAIVSTRDSYSTI